MKIFSFVSARKSITGFTVLIKFLMIIFRIKIWEGEKVAFPFIQ